MSERRLKKDSETNRQLMNSMSRTKKLYQFFAVIIATAFISSAITLTISADAPESAPNTVIDWEGLEAYKVNGIRYANPSVGTSIQDALNEMSSGGLLILPAGTYTLGSDISVVDVDGRAIIGCGAKTIVKPPSTGSSTFYIENCSNILIRDLKIDGSLLIGASHGINIDQASNVTVQNIWVTQMTDDAIIVHGPNADYNVITGCLVTDCHEGIELKGSQNTIVSYNIVLNCVEDNLELRDFYPDSGPLTGAIISGNIFDGAGDYNAWVWGKCEDVLITNNIMQNSDGYGFWVWADNATYYPQNISVVDNIITTFATNGVYQQSPMVRGLKISGNEVTGGVVGIYIAGTTWRDIMVDANILRNQTTNGILVSTEGQNITLSQNYIYSTRGTATASSIRINAGSNVHLIGNTMVLPYYAGLHITAGGVSVVGNGIYGATTQATFINSANNQFVGNTISNSDYAGIYFVSATCQNNTVTANKITTCQYGVKGATGATYNWVYANNFIGCTTANYSFASEPNYIGWNTGI